MAADADREQRLPRGAHHALCVPQPTDRAAVRFAVRGHHRLAAGCLRGARRGAAVSPAAGKRCVVAYATRARQYLWSVELPLHASIADALAAARAAADPAAPIPWDSAVVGIFAEPRAGTDAGAGGAHRQVHPPPRGD